VLDSLLTGISKKLNCRLKLCDKKCHRKQGLLIHLFFLVVYNMECPKLQFDYNLSHLVKRVILRSHYSKCAKKLVAKLVATFREKFDFCPKTPQNRAYSEQKKENFMLVPMVIDLSTN